MLSYTRLGYALRSSSWDSLEVNTDLTAKTCLVTGANAGLGLATAEGLARLGARVYMLARDADRGLAAQARVIACTGNPHVYLEYADMGNLQTVRDLAQRLRENEPGLDVLIHNASVMLPNWEQTVDGFEKTFATNVLGPFLLTHLLLPLLEKRRSARVVFVSSGGMYTQRIDVEDLQWRHKPYNGTIAYAQTKRAQVILSELWSEQVASTGITVNSMHPGWVNTPGLRRSMPAFRKLTAPFLRTPEQGADTVLWLAGAPQLAEASGKFWFDRRERPTHRLQRTRSSEEERQKLWEKCIKLSGLMIGADK